MSRVFRMGSCSLVLALALAAGACEEASQGPNDDSQLDPVAVSNALRAVNSAFESPQFRSLRALDRLAGVPSPEGLELGRTGDLVHEVLNMSAGGNLGANSAFESQRLLALGRSLNGAASSGDFPRPSAFAGTYEWDAVQGAYTRAEAPDIQASAAASCGDVSRIVLYALDPNSGEPLVPLIELGYLDIVYPCTGGIGMTLVGPGSITYVDFLLAPNATGLTLDGFVSDGSVVVRLDADYVENETPECAQYGDCAGCTYLFDILLSVDGTPLALGMHYYFAFTETGFEVENGLAFNFGGMPVELVTTEYYEAMGSGNYWVTFYSEVTLAGSLFGVIDATGGEVLYLLPNGQSMTQEEMAAMQALFAEPEALLGNISEMLEPIVSMLGPLAGEVLPPILL
jgi:hypothetical protein